MGVEPEILVATAVIALMIQNERVLVTLGMNIVPDVVMIIDRLDHHLHEPSAAEKAVSVPGIARLIDLSDVTGVGRDLLTAETDDLEALVPEDARVTTVTPSLYSRDVHQEMCRTCRFWLRKTLTCKLIDIVNLDLYPSSTDSRLLGVSHTTLKILSKTVDSERTYLCYHGFPWMLPFKDKWKRAFLQ